MDKKEHQDRIRKTDWHKVFTSEPANQITRNLVSQRGCAKQDLALSRAELARLVQTLDRKFRELKAALGITERSQHVRLVKSAGRELSKRKYMAFVEYRRLGLVMMWLQQEMGRMRRGPFFRLRED